MEAKELKELIENGLTEVKSQIVEKTKGLDGIENKTAKLIEDAEAKMKDANKEQIEEIKSEINTRIDTLVAEMKAKKVEGKKREIKSFEGEFARELEERKDELKNVGGGQKMKMELKDVAINTNNTQTGSVESPLANEDGGAVIRQGGGVILPSPIVNFSNLIRTVSGSEDTLRFWREAATSNAVAEVAKGDAKPTQVFDTPPVVFTATYRAAIYRFHKSMMRNLPWMQQRLPEMLRRNYFKAENADFYTDLLAAITATSSTEYGIINLVETIGELEAADFPVNGIVINPADWAKLSVTRTSEDEFTLPSTVTFSGGRLQVNGIPVFKASFVAENEALVGDWTQAYKYVTDGLKVELFEQDVDNVQKNAITARVEESNVLVIEQPLAFRKITTLFEVASV